MHIVTARYWHSVDGATVYNVNSALWYYCSRVVSMEWPESAPCCLVCMRFCIPFVTAVDQETTK